MYTYTAIVIQTRYAACKWSDCVSCKATWGPGVACIFSGLEAILQDKKMLPKMSSAKSYTTAFIMKRYMWI